MIRHAGPFVEWNVIVVVARENHFRTKTAFEQLAQPLGNLEHDIFFEQATPADGSQIPAAVTGIDDDAQLRHVRQQLQVFVRWRRNYDGEPLLLGSRGSGEKTYLRFGICAQLSHLYNESVRIRLQADRKIRFALGLEHDTRHARIRLRHTNPRQQRVADIDGLAFNVSGERSVVQVKVNAIGSGKTMRL